MDHFGRNICTLRKLRNMTQADLARELHISHQAVSKWEKGRSIPDAEMLTAIARYFDVTVDRLLNEEIHVPQYEACPEPIIWQQVKEEPVETTPRTKNPVGALLLIPMLVVLLTVLILPLAGMLSRSLTDYNGIEPPHFIGLENYITLFTNDVVFRIAVNNTFRSAFLTALIAGTLAYVFSLLLRKAHKVIRYIVILVFDMVSLHMLTGDALAYLLSSDNYGLLNYLLSSLGIIKEPVQFLSIYVRQIHMLFMCLILFGPMLTVLSLVKRRKIPESSSLRLFFPLESSLHVYLAGALPLLLMPLCRNASMSAFGLPSINYAAHTIIDHYCDYSAVRMQAGYASAIGMASLLLTGIYLVVIFAICCALMHLAAFIKRAFIYSHGRTEIQSGSVSDPASNIFGIILMSIGLAFLFPLFLPMMNSFKGIPELFMFPPTIVPRMPTLINYIDLFRSRFDGYTFSRWLFNMLTVPFLPALAVAIISAVSALGAAYYDYKARRPLYALVLASFVLLPTAMLPDYSNRLIYNNVMLHGFYAAFYSAAPLIGLVWFKSVIDRARQTGTGLFRAILLNSIPVISITYVMCYISPFANDFILKLPGFTLYSEIVKPATAANRGIAAAAYVIMLGIAFLFFLAAFLTAVKFFPKKEMREHKSFS